MRALVFICVLLAGCAGPALGPGMLGKLDPKLDFHANKFAMLTVEFNGARYTLEGYHIKPGPHQPSPYVTHFNALLFWDDIAYTCREKGQWHLVCFDPDGKNFSKYVDRVVRSGPMVGLEIRRKTLLSGLSGTLTPHLHQVDGKFPLFTVTFQGDEYTLEGYYAPPGTDKSDSRQTYHQAQKFLAKQTFSCDIIHSSHLICFNDNGENIAKYLKAKL